MQLVLCGYTLITDTRTLTHANTRRDKRRCEMYCQAIFRRPSIGLSLANQHSLTSVPIPMIKSVAGYFGQIEIEAHINNPTGTVIAPVQMPCNRTSAGA